MLDYRFSSKSILKSSEVVTQRLSKRTLGEKTGEAFYSEWTFFYAIYAFFSLLTIAPS